MTTELRVLVPDDDAALSRLMAEAFAGGSRPTATEPEEDKDRVSTTLGVFDGVRLVAAATIHDLHLIWGQGVLWAASRASPAPPSSAGAATSPA